MNDRPRKAGKFAHKSETTRKVRSVRATDQTWERLTAIADHQGMTVADLLENWAQTPPGAGGVIAPPNPEALSALREALPMPANRGGAIKAQIRHALALLEAL